MVQFPRRLLGLTGDMNLTSVEAYLTFPKLQSEDGALKMWGIMATGSGRLLHCSGASFIYISHPFIHSFIHLFL